MPLWYANFKWACVGAVVGVVLVFEAIMLFLGPGGLMPEDRLPVQYAIPIGFPLGAYLGWRVGPEIVPALRRLLRRH